MDTNNPTEEKHARILLCCIFKDDSEYSLIKRMLESFMPRVDGLCVALTGTSGKFTKLEKLLQKYNATYVKTSPKTHPQIYSQEEKPIFCNFAAARQVTFDLADTLEGYDWYTWADCDDILVSGEKLQEVADRSIEIGLDGVLFTYWYAINVRADNTFDQDDVVIDHIRERLLKPGIFKWVSRLHEVAIQKEDAYQPKYANYEFNINNDQIIAWAHLPGHKRVEDALMRNCRILEIQAKEENHKDPRTLFYLAKTYYDLGDTVHVTLALELLKEYLEGEFPSGWAEERAAAYEYIGNIYGRAGKHQEAVEAFHEGLKEYPNKLMLVLTLAKEYDAVGNTEKSNYWLSVAEHMEPPKARTTIGNPLEIKILASSLNYNKAIREGDLPKAIYWLKIRNQLTGETNDDRIKTMEEAVELNENGKRVFQYAKWLKDTGHVDKIPPLLESLPVELGREQFAHYIANEIKEPRVWGDNEICYYASWGAESFENWSPSSLKKGLGGSETAVIRLAEEWVKLGYRVTVYGDPGSEAGEHNGVTYRSFYEINWQDQFNILILWRSPHLLDREIKARKLYMDLHDIASQLDWTDARMERIDKVFFKSKWHRTHVPKLPDEKTEVISNGI